MEQRVLERMASGLSNGQVAERLGIPAELTWARVFATITKLGAGSKLEAIIAIRLGLVCLLSD
jgi:DNA-binding NarL/FixJ family response regulator